VSAETVPSDDEGTPAAKKVPQPEGSGDEAVIRQGKSRIDKFAMTSLLHSGGDDSEGRRSRGDDCKEGVSFTRSLCDASVACRCASSYRSSCLRSTWTPTRLALLCRSFAVLRFTTDTFLQRGALNASQNSLLSLFFPAVD
jgi:hypothetical protein